MSVRILIGDVRQRLRDLPDSSVDSVVCDPPYHLTSIVKRFGSPTAAPINNRDEQEGRNGPYHRASKGFMGQQWDGGDVAFDPDTWAEVFRVLKPGGHLVAFSGTRTYHRMAVAIEDAGFEVRDMIAWHYGSGFPKSHDISKAIDKAAGAERELIAQGAQVKRMIPGADQNKKGWKKDSGREFVPTVTAAATDAAREWEGWGTALKPATEPICLARKPLSEKSIAANVLKWGTGALNIDGCRIAHSGADDLAASQAKNPGRGDLVSSGVYGAHRPQQSVNVEGRWPANLCHDGSDEVVAGFPYTESGSIAPHHVRTTSKTKNTFGERAASPEQTHGDSGSAARFFYCAKATTEERGEGNNHPTVKPVSLMRWLVRLVTPKGGTVLDPFMGSGSTALACDAEQFDFIGCELSADYAAIAERRIRDGAGMFADVSIEHAGPSSRAAA
jgi:site-specific DNA-methyltransferase (adenine-specific)